MKSLFQLSPSRLADGFFRLTNHPRLLGSVTALCLAVIAAEGLLAEGPNALSVAMVVLLGGALAAPSLARRAPHRFWTEPVQLFLVALGLRLVATLFGECLKTSLGLLVSNPDAAVYLYWADRVGGALPRALIDIRPHGMAGSWQVFFHYFLALVLWLGKGDLLGAQAVLAMLSALSCIPVFLVSRAVAGGDGRLVGVIWALLPYSIYLGAGDFLKDALVVLAVFSVLAAASWVRGQTGRLVAALVILTASFAILRTTRFYFGVVLGIVVLTFLAAESFQAGMGRRLRSAWATNGVVIVGAAILGAELLLRVAGFPFGVPLLLETAREAVETPAAIRGAAGRADSLPGRGSTVGMPVDEESPSMTGGPSLSRDELASSERQDASVVPEMVAEGPRSQVPVLSHSRLLGVFRRLFGPYIWTPPTENFARLTMSGDIPSWLSAPAWYFALAFGALGIWRLIGERGWLSLIVATLCVTFGAVLIFFNVSFRQRDSILLPFLLIAAVVGWSGSTVPGRRRVTFAAVAVLALLSVVYWGMRAFLWH